MEKFYVTFHKNLVMFLMIGFYLYRGNIDVNVSYNYALKGDVEDVWMLIVVILWIIPLKFAKKLLLGGAP